MHIGTALTPLRYGAAKESALEEGRGETLEREERFGLPELAGCRGSGAGTVAS